MRLPRNVRILRGHLDATPYAMVFFLLVMFLMMASLLYTPGVRVDLPTAGDLPGTDNPTITVAIDVNGRLYFRNQLVEPRDLREQLRLAAKNSVEPLTLVVQADKAAPYNDIIQLTLMARDAGIHDALLATLPRMITPGTTAGKPPS